MSSIVAPLSVPYVVRKIDLTFKLGTGSFGLSGFNTITVSGLRVYAHVELVVFPTMGGILVMRVYGMTLDHMNALSVAGLLYDGRQNYVLVQAGDDSLGMATVFNGLIIEAYPNLDTAEDAHFYVYATVSNLIQLKPVQAVTYTGSTSAATIIENLAKQAGLSFQNNGVTAVLPTSYFPGTVWQQLQSAIRAADCFAYLDGATNKLVIWSKNATTAPDVSYVVSPQSGMIAYPKFQKNLIILRTLYSPMAVYTPGMTILSQSQLQAANNAKLVLSMVTYDLASQMPGGPWEVTLLGVPIGVSS